MGVGYLVRKLTIGPAFSYIIIPVSVVAVFAISYVLSVVYEKLFGLIEAKVHMTEKPVCGIIMILIHSMKAAQE